MSVIATAGQPARRRVCANTGYELVRLPAFGVWKVFDTTYHPLSSKPHNDSPRRDWSRWDLEGEDTVYGATERQGAFAEVLAPLRPRLPQLNALARAELTEGIDDFDDLESELVARGMNTGWIDAGWRFSRGVAQIYARQSQWFIDVDSVNTVNTLRLRASDLLLDLGYEDLDVSQLRSQDRDLTCELAEMMSWQVLDDGSTPAGIRFESRHGSNYECWAIWKRAQPFLAGDPTTEVAIDDPDYKYILDAFRLQAR